MEIHELNTYSGSLGSSTFLAVDDGADTAKVSTQTLLLPVKNEIDQAQKSLNARIDNIIAGGDAPSEAEIIDARLGADGFDYPSLGDAIRGQANSLSEEINKLAFSGNFSIDAAIESWEIGTIDAATGATTANTKRLRTSNYVKVNEGEKIIFNIDPGFVYEVLYYDSASVAGYVSGDMIAWTGDETIIRPAHPYIKIIIADSTYQQTALLSWADNLSAIYETYINELESKVDNIESAIVEECDNLLDPSTYEYNTSNTVISGFMEVTGGASYGFLMYSGYWELRQYDDTKTLIKTTTVTASTYIQNQIQVLEANTAFIRVVVLTTNQGFDMCIKEGNIVPTFVPYNGYKYSFTNSDYIKESEINYQYDFSSYGLAYIEDNKLKANVWTDQAQTAVYSCVDTGADCYQMKCKAFFSSAGSNSTIALISTKLHNKNVNDILTKSLHPVFTRTGVKVDFLDNSVFTNIYTETYGTPLTSGVEYEFGWKITAADTIVITTASGDHTVNMPGYDFTDYIGHYCILEHYNGNGGAQDGMPWFTSWIAQDSANKVILFDLFTKPDSVLQNTLNGLPYYQFSNHTGWRVTN